MSCPDPDNEPLASSPQDENSVASAPSEFEKELAAIAAPEERIRLALDRMKTSLSQEGKPDLKLFWEVRRCCINLFKEGTHPAVRSQFWAEYRDLTTEAHRLKDSLDKESEFAAEQIELAVQGIEEEVARLQELIQSAPPVELSMPSQRLAPRVNFYDPIQREISRLTSWAGRINALRKELIQTEMRVGRKTKLFRRLSAAGDSVFPRRKDLIQEISQAFLSDVEEFTSSMQGDRPPASPHILRDEIRSFQAFAKVLTLGSKAFTESREKLSRCWDKVQGWADDWKKEQTEKRGSFQEAYSEFSQRLQQVAGRVKSDSIEEASAALERLGSDLRLAALGGRERKQIRSQLFELEKELAARQEIETDNQRQRQKHEAERSAELADALEAKIVDVLRAVDEGRAEGRSQAHELLNELAQVSLVNDDQQRIEKKREQLEEALCLFNEEEQLAQSRGQESEEQVLEDVLASRKKRRAEVSKRVESLRREAGSSGLGFEAAMIARQMLDAERQLLADVTRAIEDIERRLQVIARS